MSHEHPRDPIVCAECGKELPDGVTPKRFGVRSVCYECCQKLERELRESLSSDDYPGSTEVTE